MATQSPAFLASPACEMHAYEPHAREIRKTLSIPMSRRIGRATRPILIIWKAS
jgi:hypothetical protein